MKVVKIGDIDLTYGLWWLNFDENQEFTSEVLNTIDGGLVVFTQPIKLNAQYINLSSEDDGWQTKEVKDAISNLVRLNNSDFTTITTSDNEVINVRFAYENKVFEVEKVSNVLKSKYYKIKLNLGRV